MENKINMSRDIRSLSFMYMHKTDNHWEKVSRFGVHFLIWRMYP